MEAADRFMELYERERELVLVFVARRTLDVGVAADLTAETFAIALGSWSRLRDRREEEVRAWLLTVARRQVSRYLRRARVERRTPVAHRGHEAPRRRCRSHPIRTNTQKSWQSRLRRGRLIVSDHKQRRMIVCLETRATVTGGRCASIDGIQEPDIST
jgi:DNA-directed RNA polymerase specialized sigma24 family protein